MNNPVKLFIVEGEDRDYRFVNEMSECFFNKGRFESKVINLPASQNIYMLYKILEEDDFDSDIVEILRDKVYSAKEKLNGINRQNIDEIYLFFDYDIHQNNLSQYSEIEPDDVLKTMLENFDNETENGKLYISYPMVEALYDYKDDLCETYSSCYFEINNLVKYNEASGKNNPKASTHFKYYEWKASLNVFIMRLMCLFNVKNITFEFYRKNITPGSIYEREYALKEENNLVFILSGFSEFILDYFKIDFWNANIKSKKNKYINCIRLIQK